MRDGGAKPGDIGGAVDVDVALAGIGVVGFEAMQAEDAGQDGILALGGRRVGADG